MRVRSANRSRQARLGWLLQRAGCRHSGGAGEPAPRIHRSERPPSSVAARFAVGERGAIPRPVPNPVGGESQEHRIALSQAAAPEGCFADPPPCTGRGRLGKGSSSSGISKTARFVPAHIIESIDLVWPKLCLPCSNFAGERTNPQAGISARRARSKNPVPGRPAASVQAGNLI